MIGFIAFLLPLTALAGEPDFVSAATAGSFSAASGVIALRQSSEMRTEWKRMLPKEHKAVEEAREALAAAKAQGAGVEEARVNLKAKSDELNVARKQIMKSKLISDSQMKLREKLKVRSVSRGISALAMTGAGYLTVRSLIGTPQEFAPAVIEDIHQPRKKNDAITNMLYEKYDPSLNADTAE